MDMVNDLIQMLKEHQTNSWNPLDILFIKQLHLKKKKLGIPWQFSD